MSTSALPGQGTSFKSMSQSVLVCFRATMIFAKLVHLYEERPSPAYPICGKGLCTLKSCCGLKLHGKRVPGAIAPSVDLAMHNCVRCSA